MAAALPVARLESMRALSALLREAQPRETAEESVFQDVLEILTSTASALEQTRKDSCGLTDLDTCLLLIAECFRCLRNACVECAKNQHVLRNLGLISTSVHLIKLLHGIQIKEELLLTGPLIVPWIHPQTVLLSYSICSGPDWFSCIFSVNENPIVLDPLVLYALLMVWEESAFGSVL